MKYLFAYIHLNPIKSLDPKNWENKIIKNKTSAQDYLKQYEYSSYLYYSGQARPSDAILEPATFPEYFTKPRVFSEFIKDWINYSPEQ